MVAGHLREKNGYYHMVLNYVDEYGKRHTPSKSTGLTVKGNKKRAEKMLSEARAAKEAELEARAIERSTGKAPVGTILFTAFLLDWLEMTKKNVEETTYGAYAMGIKNKIIPYFEEHHPGLALCEVTPKHIQDYYTYELTVRGVSANTVIHRHANIRKALQHAFKLGLIDSNPADRIERPKKEKFVGSFYEEDELNHLFEVVRGDPIELGVILGAFYGLRRSEAVGLKWDAMHHSNSLCFLRVEQYSLSADIDLTRIQIFHLQPGFRFQSALQNQKQQKVSRSRLLHFCLSFPDKKVRIVLKMFGPFALTIPMLFSQVLYANQKQLQRNLFRQAVF